MSIFAKPAAVLFARRLADALSIARALVCMLAMTLREIARVVGSRFGRPQATRMFGHAHRSVVTRFAALPTSWTRFTVCASNAAKRSARCLVTRGAGSTAPRHARKQTLWCCWQKRGVLVRRATRTGVGAYAWRRYLVQEFRTTDSYQSTRTRRARPAERENLARHLFGQPLARFGSSTEPRANSQRFPAHLTTLITLSHSRASTFAACTTSSTFRCFQALTTSASTTGIGRICGNSVSSF